MSRKPLYEIQETELIKFLKARMIELRINQATLARMTGLSPCGISLILTKGNMPGTNTLNLFAKALDVPAEKLFRLAGILPKEQETDTEVNEAMKELEYYFARLTPDKKEIVIGFARSLSYKRPQLPEEECILVSQPELAGISGS